MQIKDNMDTLLPIWEANRFVSGAHNTRTKLRTKIKRTAATGNRKKLRALKHKYFGSLHVKVSALYKAGVRLPSKNDWLMEACLLDLRLPVTEPVIWWKRPKRSGGVRTVCKLPPHLYAAHIMIADVLSAQMAPPSFIYNLKGAGREDLVSEVLNKLRTGFNHYRIYDVRDCFTNVSTDAIHNLNLPRRLVTNTLNTEKLRFQQVAPDEATQSDTIPIDTISNEAVVCGPTGVLAGSPASNLILANLLKDMPQPPVGDGYVFVYCDDLIVLAKSAEVCDCIETSLLDFFGQSAVGPFTLNKKAAGARSSFEYLGYEFAYDPISQRWSVGLSQSNWMSLVKRRHDDLLKLHVENPHGIFVDDMKGIRDMLRGHPSLSDPETVLRAICDVGPDNVEILAARNREKTNNRK